MRNDFESNYLMHHGILGQKWGIRNYQNPDGSLTEAGRKRYGVGPGKSVGDISTVKGAKRREKDLKKAIKLNNKKQGKEYTKIANNPENFLGLNKKHAKKISEYSENIKKGEEELKRLKILQDDLKEYKKVYKDAEAGDTKAKETVNKWEQDFLSSKENKKAHNDAYNDTLNWYKKNDPEQLSAWIKNNDGKTTGLDAFHDFRKMYEGYDDEYTSKAQERYVINAKNAEKDRIQKLESKRNSFKADEDKDLWERGVTAKDSKDRKEAITDRVNYAKETGMFDMEFLERNLDLDPVTEEQMSGKKLYDAYEKFLEEEYEKK